MKLLILASTYEIGNQMSGIGLRLWELAQVLADHVSVTLLSKRTEISHPRIVCKDESEASWEEEIDEADAVMCSDLPDPRILLYAHQKNKLIISENAVPLEHLDYSAIRSSKEREQYYQEIVAGYKLQLLLSDHFLARASIEQATLYASLGLFGRINFQTYSLADQMQQLVSHIPIGFNRFSEAYAAKQEPNGTHEFVWNGGIWDFYEPCWVPEAIAMLQKRSVSVRATFMYMQAIEQGLVEVNRLVDRTKELGVSEAIDFHYQSVGHFSRDALLKGARALLCIGRSSMENQTCHRLRLRDAFLYEKPMIVDAFGATGDLVERLQIGVTVRSQAELADAMERLKYSEDYYQSLVSNIRRMKAQYQMENNLTGLLRFLQQGKKAADADFAVRQAFLHQLLDQFPMLHEAPVQPI